MYSQVGNYFWPRISKIYFKGKYFMLRVRDKNNDENTYGFETPSRQACKHLWKCCVEHHAFFRLVQVCSKSPGLSVISPVCPGEPYHGGHHRGGLWSRLQVQVGPGPSLLISPSTINAWCEMCAMNSPYPGETVSCKAPVSSRLESAKPGCDGT